MAIGETLNASPITVAEAFSDVRRYIIPPFQRDYSWEKDQWEELWADICSLRASSASQGDHFLGAIVLQPTGERSEYRIIDGQQRLVTLSLLALAVIGRINRLASAGTEPDDNRERVRLLREAFVSKKDAVSLQYRPRIVLNQTDNPFYSNYLVQGKVHPRPKGLRASEKRLHDGLEYFDEQLEALSGEREPTGAELVELLHDVVARRLRFIEIVVQNDETAFTVFETLNARGVALGTADLLKNYLFSEASKHGSQSDLEGAQGLWQMTLQLVPMDQLSTMLFHQLAGSVEHLREKRVFSAIKQVVPKERDVFAFLRDMRATAEIYAALDDPDADLWEEFEGAREFVRVLKVLRVEQCRPLILAAVDRFDDQRKKLAQLLKNIVVISVRTTIARINTGDVQRAYHNAALGTRKGELKSPLAMVRALKGLNVPDEAFRANFAKLEINPKGRSKALLRYLLDELERAYGGQSISDATIEHVLPENPSSAWDGFTANEHSNFLNRLGNLTPLEFKLNHGIGAAAYERKRETYRTSKYALTRSLDSAEWTPEVIRRRQEDMAQKATAIWRIEGHADESWRVEGSPRGT